MNVANRAVAGQRLQARVQSKKAQQSRKSTLAKFGYREPLKPLNRTKSKTLPSGRRQLAAL